MNSKELVLKEMFGKNKEYAGYDNIITRLIETENCITTIYASDKFKGGIWNFVKEKPYSDGIDLIEFTLDKDEVYKSELFKAYKTHMLNDKKEELNELMVEVEKIQRFIKDLS